jgi:hypothetical protein
MVLPHYPGPPADRTAEPQLTVALPSEEEPDADRGDPLSSPDVIRVVWWVLTQPSELLLELLVRHRRGRLPGHGDDGRAVAAARRCNHEQQDGEPWPPSPAARVTPCCGSARGAWRWPMPAPGRSAPHLRRPALRASAACQSTDIRDKSPFPCCTRSRPGAASMSWPRPHRRLFRRVGSIALRTA